MLYFYIILCLSLSLIVVVDAIKSSLQEETVIVLESPKLTDYGDWGQFENCSYGLLVKGYVLTIEYYYDNNRDNTALNSVKLFCGNPIANRIEDLSSKRGSFGEEGEFMETQFCPPLSYVTGFQMRSQENQGFGSDDVAAINLRLFCNDGTVLFGYSQNHPYKNSVYTQRKECPTDYGVCGLQTQVQGRQGSGDDTALNNIRVLCCPVPKDFFAILTL